jgi:hypothetical protein
MDHFEDSKWSLFRAYSADFFIDIQLAARQRKVEKEKETLAR